jgi:hypothetical protein
MGSPSFPHLLSPSKAAQVIYKTKKKGSKKKTTSAPNEDLDPLPVPVPPTTQRQDTTLIFVELSDWVTNRLKNPCGAGFKSKGFTSSDGERCTGVISFEMI